MQKLKSRTPSIGNRRLLSDNFKSSSPMSQRSSADTKIEEKFKPFATSSVKDNKINKINRTTIVKDQSDTIHRPQKSILIIEKNDSKTNSLM
jgi:hypothetical protein